MPYTTGKDKQILVGAAAFFVADATEGATLPAALTPATSSAKEVFSAATGWENVGYTDGGVEVSYEPTYGDVTVDQLLDSAVIFKSGMKVTVNTTFTEATLEHLLIVWGQTEESLDTGVLSIEGGSLGEAPHERALAFVGPGPRTADNNERIYHVTRAIQTSTTAHALKRDAATSLPVSFRCLPNTANGGTSYGTVRDRAYTVAP